MDPRMYMLTPEQMGGPAGIMDAINRQQQQSAQLAKQLYDNMQARAQAQYAPQNALSDMLKNQYAAQQAGITTGNLDQTQKSDIQQKLAQAFASRGQGAEAFAQANQIGTLTPAEKALKEAQANFYNMGGGRGGVVNQTESQYQNGLANDNPNLKGDPTQLIVADQIVRNGGNKMPDGTPINLSPRTRDYLDELTNSKYTAAQKNQQGYAKTLEDLFQNVDKNADQAFKFAGLAGQSKLGYEQFLAQADKSTPEYQAYNKYVNEDVPALVSEIIRAGGSHSTNSQKAIAFLQALPNLLKSGDYANAKSQYDELKNVYRTVGQSITATPSERSAALKNAKDNTPEQKLTNSMQGKSKKAAKDMTDDEIRAELANLSGGG